MGYNKSKGEHSDIIKRDYVTNKLLLVFTLSFALLLLFTSIGRMMKSTATFMTAWNMAKIVSGVSFAVLVAGIIMIFVERKKGINTKYKLFSGKNVSIAAALIALCSTALSLIFSPNMLMLLYVFIPAVVVLYIVYYSYPSDFFMIALSSIISGAGIWLLLSDIVISSDVIVLLVAAALIVALAVITIIAQALSAKLKLFGRELVLFRHDAKFALVYLTYVLALMLLAAAFLAADLATFFIFGLVGYLLLTGIYYTVKLI